MTPNERERQLEEEKRQQLERESNEQQRQHDINAGRKEKEDCQNCPDED